MDTKQTMQRKMSLADYDKAIIEKLGYILALIKLMTREKKFSNLLYATKK